MKAKQSNPTKPRYDKDSGKQFNAHAPYNFVPLPPELVVEAKPPLPQNRFNKGGLTGTIEYTLTTESPTYVRGMLTEKEYKDFGQKKWSDLKDLPANERRAIQKKKSPFFSTKEDKEQKPLPTLPGSSLRGMFRTLIEIIGHGHMRWVADEPVFSFRAVANISDDPLRYPYKDVIGNMASKVKAGYVEKHGDNWMIRPALTQKQVGWSERSNDQYVKVYDEDITFEGFLPFNHKDYKPQIHVVGFKRGPEKRKSDWDRRRGKPMRPSLIVEKGGTGLERGMLVCTGAMLETNDGKTKSPRKKHVIVLRPNPDNELLLTIPQQAVKDYRASLTPFQKENLTKWGGGDLGCLGERKPIFYIPNRDNTVTYFGHTLNFRIPALLSGSDRAATPRDFVPDVLHTGTNPDLAEAMFGWVEQEDEEDGLKGQCAGRVFFSDAQYETHDAQSKLWYSESEIPLQILATPKPTTFQHYLVQDKQKGHDSDQMSRLAHYGSSPDKTQIRGYKLYWHKGKNPTIQASADDVVEDKDGKKKRESQLTYAKPVNPGVVFKGEIQFDQLRPEELGALLWVLDVAGNDRFRLKLGMGKPLGMGAVRIESSLSLVNPDWRYDSLFRHKTWRSGNFSASSSHKKAERAKKKFHEFVLKRLGKNKIGKIDGLYRIQQLLAMLSWRGPVDPAQETRYMAIERDGDKANEYKLRPVLPTPEKVLADSDRAQWEKVRGENAGN